MLVHAHPDDETITTGATMARYASEGARVSLLTGTLGEFGEIIPPELAELEWNRGDQLGGYRMGELATALAALGVTDHRFLGGPGRFRDSGMMGTASNEHVRAFWRGATQTANFAAAVRAAVEVVRAVRPHVLVTYDPNGGYGHPDHIMAHRVATAAVDAAADPGFAAAGKPWAVAKLYWTAWSRTDLRAELANHVPAATGFDPQDPDGIVGALADEDITTTVDGTAYVGAKAAALRAHATQVSVAGDFFALSNNLALPLSGVEHYRLVRGRRGGPPDARGHERDLFAGLDVAALDLADTDTDTADTDAADTDAADSDTADTDAADSDTADPADGPVG